MTTFQGIAVLAGVWRRGVVNRARASLRESALKTWTLAAFLILYLLVGFILFRYGMIYLYRLPIVGGVLVERVVYMLFFSFLVMLIFSNGIINFMGLFRNRETQWVMSLPIPASSLLLWKTMETLAMSSWGLLLLSAPILLAFGITAEADLWFYAKTLLMFVPFLIVPACLGTWILLLGIRYYKKWWNWVAAGIFLTLGVRLVQSLAFRSKLENVDPDAEGMLIPQTMGGLGGVLSYTEGSMNALLPSSWLSDSVMSWSRGYEGAGWFHGLLMLSYALMSLLITYWLGRRFFLATWNASASRSGGREESGPKRREARAIPLALGWVKVFPQQLRGLLVKDLLTMWRDGSQRIQFLIVFGLLFFYSLNIQNLGYNLKNPAWLIAVSYLNLIICTLALSMLTTRFIFPQFSMEGQRIWILGMSPLPLTRVLWQKLATGVALTMICTLPLIILSCVVMKLPWTHIAYYSVAMVLMNVGLNALAVCFGAIFPNMRDINPSRIVSGFGGTLCLLASFVYILLHILVLLLPALGKLSSSGRWISEYTGMISCVAFLVAFNVFMVSVLTFLAKKQIKNWKF